MVIFLSNDYPRPFANTWMWEVSCVLVSMFGALIRAIAVGTTPSGTSGRNVHGQVATSLNTSGIYSVVRHPLYVGNFFSILGLVLWTGVWWFILLAGVLFWFYYERIMYTEEAFLLREFGDEFRNWAAIIPAAIPSFKHYQPARLPFSLKMVLNREYSGFLAIAASFLILEGLQYINAGKKESFDMLWIVFFVGAFLIASTLRYLRKRTSVLHIDVRG